MLRSLWKDTAVYGFTDFLFRFLNFAIFPILSYALSLAEFGVYALLTTFALLMAALFNCGLNRSLERFYQDEGQRSAAISMGLLCEGIFALMFICPAIFLIYWYREGLFIHWMAFAIALITCLPTQLFNLSLNAIRLQFLPWHFTALTLLQNGISLSCSLYFILFLKWGVAGFLGGMLLGYSVGAPLAIYLLYKRVRWVWDFNLAKEMLKFGYPFLYIDVARWIFTSLDRWMLAEFATAEEVGLYSIAFKLSTVLIFMISAFSLAWTPHALKAFREDPHHRTLYSRCFTLWFFALSGVAILLNLFGKEALMLLTPPSYWAAAHLIPYVATGLALFGTTYVSIIGMMITKETHHLTWVAWGAAVLNIALNFLLIPSFGAMGAAVTSLITSAVLSLYYLICAQRLYPIPLELGKLAFALVLLLGSAALSSLFNAFPWSYGMLLLKLSAIGIVFFVYRMVYKNSQSVFIEKRAENFGLSKFPLLM